MFNLFRIGSVTRAAPKPWRYASQMKLNISENIFQVNHGPAWGSGIFLTIFGTPFLFGGVASILAYFGLFPSESEIDLAEVFIGMLLSVIGVVFIFCGFNSIFGYESFEFHLDQEILRISNDGRKKKKYIEYNFSEIDQIQSIVTSEEYRTGKLGSIVIVLMNGEDITLVEDMYYTKIIDLIDRIGENTNIKIKNA